MSTTTKNTSTKKENAKLTSNEIIEATALKLKSKKTIFERKTDLENKEGKSTFDYVKLANVSDKIENKTASKVYKNCIENVYINDITGLNDIPTFAQFTAKLTKKVSGIAGQSPSYSNWDGYKAFAKFNVKNNVATKVKRQNKAEAKK